MFSFRSIELFKDLQKFFSKEFEKARLVLVTKLAQEEDQLVETEFSKEFSKEFFEMLTVAKTSFLPNQILKNLKWHYKKLEEEFGDIECFISVANYLSDEEKIQIEKQLKEKFEKKLERKLKFLYSVDESLIGGMVIRLNGKYYDGSFKKILFDIQSRMQEDIL